jgi:hypothetical protein
MIDREVERPVWAVLGADQCLSDRSWVRGLCWRSWAALGVHAGGPGPLLGFMLAVLGRSWDLCWRSWAALGTYVGGPGVLLGTMLAVLGCWDRRARPDRPDRWAGPEPSEAQSLCFQ